MPIPPDPPHRRIFLASVGATPQVVTETLHALATGSTKWWPEKILILTTESAHDAFRKGNPQRGIPPLLGRGGKLAELARALHLPLPEGAVTVTVPTLPDGTAIRDVRSDSEVEAFANRLFAIVARLASNPGNELHVSLAGGRKSMSFITGQIMSLLGRPQDQLSHVLLEPASLESQPDFWWPGDGSPGAEAAVTRLYPVPYLRVRAWKDMADIAATGNFAAAVSHANQLLQARDLVVDLADGSLTVAGVRILLPPQELGTMALIALAHLKGEPLQRCTGWNPENPKERALFMAGSREQAAFLWAWLVAAADFERLYRDQLAVSFHLFDAHVAELAGRLDYDQGFLPLVSRIRRTLRQQLSPRLAATILKPRQFETAFEVEALHVLLPKALLSHPARPLETETVG